VFRREDSKEQEGEGGDKEAVGGETVEGEVGGRLYPHWIGCGKKTVEKKKTGETLTREKRNSPEKEGWRARKKGLV